MQQIKDRGCQIVDTTCGDVMSVWKRVRKYASESATSIIHGKAEHEETKATSSRALGDGKGHYLVVLTLAETDYVCDYIRHGGEQSRRSSKNSSNAYSPGFDPDLHLQTIGVANQTTMLRGETEEVQRRIRQAIVDRDGPEGAAKNFRFFDTICGATQERQDALARDARRADGFAPGRRRLQQLEHFAPGGNGRGKAADLFCPQRLPPRFRPARSCITTCTQSAEVIARDWLPAGPDHRRHHRRRLLSEQPDRGDPHSAFRAARHQPRAARSGGVKIFCSGGLGSPAAGFGGHRPPATGASREVSSYACNLERQYQLRPRQHSHRSLPGDAEGGSQVPAPRGEAT